MSTKSKSDNTCESSDSDSEASSSVELDDSDFEDEKELKNTLESYDNPKGSEETMGPVMTSEQSEHLLKELKSLDPKKKKQMFELFSNLAKQQGNFGDNAFKRVSEDGRMTNRERLREAIRNKSHARKSKATLLRMQQQLEEKQLEEKSQTTDNNDTESTSRSKSQKKRDRKKRAKERKLQETTQSQDAEKEPVA